MDEGYGSDLIRTIVEKCCKEICELEEMFLGEMNIVCELYRRVAQQIDWRKLHTEVRPYKPDPENISNIRSVICASDRWKTVKLRKRRKKNPNYALRVDFAVINYDMVFKIKKRELIVDNGVYLVINGEIEEKPLSEIKIQYNELYVPIEALKVVVEVKHGFRNHETVITRDIQKLAIIKKENPKCEVIMLIVAPAREKDDSQVTMHQEMADTLNVKLIYLANKE